VKVASRHPNPEAHVLFRLWLITSLIVAFVAASWAFGIRLTPGVDQAGFAGRDAAFSISQMDDDRGR
jgi:hypothetical protein